jgi:hypothetical protein
VALPERTGAMKKQTVGDIADRLSSQFPVIQYAEIYQIVSECDKDFTGCPVQDYLGILVERAAREQLANLLSTELAPAVGPRAQSALARPSTVIRPGTTLGPGPSKPGPGASTQVHQGRPHMNWFRTAIGDGTAWVVL